MKISTGHPFSIALLNVTTIPMPPSPLPMQPSIDTQISILSPRRHFGLLPSLCIFRGIQNTHILIVWIPSSFVRALSRSKSNRKENLGFVHTLRARYSLQGTNQYKLFDDIAYRSSLHRIFPTRKPGESPNPQDASLSVFSSALCPESGWCTP